MTPAKRRSEAPAKERAASPVRKATTQKASADVVASPPRARPAPKYAAAAAPPGDAAELAIATTESTETRPDASANQPWTPPPERYRALHPERIWPD